MSGFAEEHFMDDNTFKNMKRTFDSHGYTMDPNAAAVSLVGDAMASKDNNGNSIKNQIRSDTYTIDDARIGCICVE